MREQTYVLELKVFIAATSTAEAADKITKVLYDAIVDGALADYRGTGQPRLEGSQE